MAAVDDLSGGLEESALQDVGGDGGVPAAEAGVPSVSDVDADLLLQRAEEFLKVVGRSVSGAAR